MKFVRMLATGLLYFCVATVLAETVLVAMLWWKGTLSDDRLVAMFAALHGIHPEMPATAAVAAKEESKEHPSLEAISRKRLLASLDLDLRETTMDKALIDLRTLEADIATESRRLQQWQDGMEKRISQAENNVLDASLQELQRTLEVISPKQAKEQILKMLQTTPDGNDTRAMSDVVRILKAMQLDKRKKILGEFKTPTESEKLADILKEIRLSPVEMDLLRDSRSQLEGNDAAKR